MHRRGSSGNSYLDTSLQFSNSEIFAAPNICSTSDFCTDKSDFPSWQIWFASSEMFDLIQESCPTWKYGAMANPVFSDKISCNRKLFFPEINKNTKSFRQHFRRPSGFFSSSVAQRLGLESLAISNVLSIKWEQFSRYPKVFPNNPEQGGDLRTLTSALSSEPTISHFL